MELTTLASDSLLLSNMLGRVRAIREASVGGCEIGSLSASAVGEKIIFVTRLGIYTHAFHLPVTVMHRFGFEHDVFLSESVLEMQKTVQSVLQSITSGKSVGEKQRRSLRAELGDSDYLKLMFAFVTERMRPSVNPYDYQPHGENVALILAFRHELLGIWHDIQPTLATILKRVEISPAEGSPLVASALNQLLNPKLENPPAVSLSLDPVFLNATLRITVEPDLIYVCGLNDVSVVTTVDNPEE
mgnify:CR=1 FL=1